MKDLKHTPSPWILKAGEIRASTKLICDPYEGRNYNGNRLLPIDEREANAKLIAPAPELLEALKGLLNSINPRSYGLKDWTEITDYIGGVTMPTDEPIFKAIEAYKKATE